MIEKNQIKFENEQIHFVIDNADKIYFNAKDIASVLGYSNKKKAIIEHVDTDDKFMLRDLNLEEKIKKHPQSMYINESGLYSLILSSKLPTAKKFKKWITSEVLPSIKGYAYLRIKNKVTLLMKKIDALEKEKKLMKADLKKDKYPNGGIVYALDYSDDNDEIYRIGKTDNMKERKSVYDTHTLHKHFVAHYQEIQCPIRLETCVRALLFDYRYMDKRDYYVCDKKTLKKAFEKCVESIKCMNQDGGSDIINLSHLKETLKNLEKRMKKMEALLDK